MFNYLRKQVSKYILSKEINKFYNISKDNSCVIEAVEFEVPENAQYNPRIPELIHGKLES